MTAPSYRFQAENTVLTDFYQEVITGLSASPRRIPAKYFYDEAGSRLFSEICKQPEYYPTRTEQAMLAQFGSEISNLTGTGCHFIEPGSGNCEKARMLFDVIRPATYVPIDISCKHLHESARQLAGDFPWLDVHAVCADITRPVPLSFIPDGAKRIVFYPGSSIGNYEPDEAAGFLRQFAVLAGPGGGLLIGVDLRKESDILNSAYNDVMGVTAEFNLNLLERINRELEGDIDVGSFRHHAFYDEEKGRIEMHLVSECAQTLRVDGHTFEFSAGESIHTENSYKYTTTGFRALAEQAGFRSVATWLDDRQLFSLHFLRAVS